MRRRWSRVEHHPVTLVGVPRRLANRTILSHDLEGLQAQKLQNVAHYTFSLSAVVAHGMIADGRGEIV